MAIEVGPRELLTGYTIRRHFEANKQRPNCCSAMGTSMKGAFARNTKGANMPAQDADAIPSGTSGLHEMPKGSDLLVAALENEGVDRIFGVPGEENLDVVESLRNSSIKLILTRHEQGAAFMAATYGRLTGKPGVCITTLGPGALNLTTGAAYALLGAMPMIMLTGQKGIMSSRQAIPNCRRS